MNSRCFYFMRLLQNSTLSYNIRFFSLSTSLILSLQLTHKVRPKSFNFRQHRLRRLITRLLFTHFQQILNRISPSLRQLVNLHIIHNPCILKNPFETLQRLKQHPILHQHQPSIKLQLQMILHLHLLILFIHQIRHSHKEIQLWLYSPCNRACGL